MAQTVTLNNGVTMPILGLGVFQIPEDRTLAAVEAALAEGLAVRGEQAQQARLQVTDWLQRIGLR